MTEIAFHFGANDKLAYTCRLLRKATSTGARLLVRGPADRMAALDIALWNVGAVDFVTHCDASAAQHIQQRSAVMLQDEAAPLRPEWPILVNLSDDVPQGFERFQRVIEVVSTEDADRNLARQRWKQYTERGYAITRHDLTARAGG